MDIYAQNILDRYKEPFYKGRNIRADLAAEENNYSCGDKVNVKLEVENKKIKAYTFDGAGCAISMAAADMIGDLIIGRTIEEAEKMPDNDLLEALGIEISPRRLPCALLGLKAVRRSLTHSTIRPSMTIEEVLTIKPNASTILADYGLSCAGCELGSVETLEEGAQGHGLSEKETEEMISRINTLKDLV